jgi:predicted CXXCH cytochrome family protein
MKHRIVVGALLILQGLVFLGDTTAPPLVILAPTDSTSYDAGKILLVSMLKEYDSTVTLSAQWEQTRFFSLKLADSKENFASDVYKLFGPGMTVQTLTYSLALFKGFTPAKVLQYAYTDSMNIRRLWQRPEFVQFVKDVQLSSNASAVLVSLRGWVDSTYRTEYDDPNADGRALYKIQARLVPGVNTLFCAPGGRRGDAVHYTTTLGTESMPISSRTARFHNSEQEQGCTSCHDGLPSADSGASMNADCNVCHKAMSSGATYLHGPAEMKECASCHTWSADSRSVSTSKDVPALCFDCHADKQAQVDSSAVQHPVAGECLTCHSPHGSEQPHVVKTDVYTLCTGCHEEQKANHPVGRHPMRFAVLRTGDEISCVSCHNPHGSPNEGLLRVPGGKMEICGECH